MSLSVQLDLVGLHDTDEEELRILSSQLRRSLLELDVYDVQLARSSDTSLSGAKSGELIAAGTVVVAAAPLALRQILQLANTWLKNRPVRGVRVELNGRTIELSDATAIERQRLIDAFLEDYEQLHDGETDTEQRQPFTS